MIKNILKGLGVLGFIAFGFIGYLLGSADINPSQIFSPVKPFDIVKAQDSEDTQQCKTDKSKALFLGLTQRLKTQSDKYLYIVEGEDSPNTKDMALQKLAIASHSELEELSTIAQTALDCQQDAYDLNELTQCQEALTTSSLPYMTAFSKLEVKRTGSFEAALFKFGMETTFGRRIHYLAINNRIIKQCS